MTGVVAESIPYWSGMLYYTYDVGTQMVHPVLTATTWRLDGSSLPHHLGDGQHEISAKFCTFPNTVNAQLRKTVCPPTNTLSGTPIKNLAQLFDNVPCSARQSILDKQNREGLQSTTDREKERSNWWSERWQSSTTSSPLGWSCG